MAKEEKIFLKPKDDIEEVIDKVKNSKASKVILNIPEGSVLKSSLDNFHTLKRESLQADKDLLIESVDPHIEELADLSKIDSLNPVFGKKERMVADIIPKSKLEGSSSSKKQQIKNNEFFSGNFKKKKKKKEKSWFSKIFKRSKNKKSKKKKKTKKKSKSKRDWINLKWIAKKWVSITITLLTLGVLYFIGFYILPQAEIMVNINRTEALVDYSVQVNTDISTTTSNDGDFDLTIPGEIIISNKNTQMKFEASEERNVERKAKGDLVIYNKFEEDIPLVENTRFRSPDGNIYKTDNAITLPAADTSGDSVSPSQVNVSVTAEEAGEDYNINPSSDERWKMPGLQENGFNERYQKTYAIPEGRMTGGLIGYAKDPTDEDINNATESVINTLTNLLKNEVLITGTSDFRVLDEASEFQIIDENVNREVDEDGNFSVFANAEMKNFAFKDQELKKTLFNEASDIKYPVRFIEENLNYENINIDWDNGIMTFDVSGSIYVKPKVDTDEFTSKVLGKGKQEISSVLDSIPDLDNAKVSLWPFWVKSVPLKASKVNITIK